MKNHGPRRRWRLFGHRLRRPFGHIEATTGAAQGRTLAKMDGVSNLSGAGVGIAVRDSGVVFADGRIAADAREFSAPRVKAKVVEPGD